MATDTVTLFDYEAGNLNEREIVEMVAYMVAEDEFDFLPPKFKRMAKTYMAKGIIDDEGNINYIKLKEED